MNLIYFVLMFVWVNLMFGQIPTNGLVERFTFDNTVNGVNGSVLLPLKQTYTTDRFGNPNSAYFVQIDSNTVQASNSVPLPQGNSDRTISLWFKNKSNWIKQYFSYSLNSNAFQIGYYNGQMGESIYTAGNASAACCINISIPYDTLWHNTIVTIENGVTSYYFDGTFKVSDTITYNNNDNNIRIGLAPVTPILPYINFLIDDIIIYNRALSVSEIGQLSPTTVELFDDLGSIETFSLFPNPSIEIIELSFENSTNRTIEIVDNSGKIILQQRLSEKLNFVELSNIEPGLYCVIIRSKDCLIKKKIVKQ